MSACRIVKKSTLFNALTATAAAEAANFPFCTIEPNTGRVAVPDDRLRKLSAIAARREPFPPSWNSSISRDLVRGASKGEGLGNRSSPISARWTPSAMCSVASRTKTLPMWKAASIQYATRNRGNRIDAGGLEASKTRPAVDEKIRGGDKDAKKILDLVERGLALLKEGNLARMVEIEDDERKLFGMLRLLTAKPILYLQCR